LSSGGFIAEACRDDYVSMPNRRFQSVFVKLQASACVGRQHQDRQL